MSKKLRLIAGVILAIVAIAGFAGWNYLYGGNVKGDANALYVYIPEGTTFNQLRDSLKLKDILKDVGSFEQVASLMKYKKDDGNHPIRTGRYQLERGWGNRRIIQHLRSGKQAPVKVVLNYERLPEEVAAKVARFLQADSAALMTQAFQNDTLLQQLGLTRETVMTVCIPNSYEMFWSTSPVDFLKRMNKETKAFWEKNGRMDKLKAVGAAYGIADFTPAKAYTLASIVEKETNQLSEKATIAGVYLNRLKVGMKLEADPTSVFARRDFAAKRVTDYHTKFDNPYNTYYYAGLPPGPISLSSIASIDAVLNPETHEYIFFCAKGDETGLHNFARNMEGHQQNIVIYKTNLQQRGLR